MSDLVSLPELSRCVPALLTGVLRGMAQARDPYEKYYDEFGNPYSQVPDDSFGALPIGALIAGGIISLALQIMFGLWGKQAADQHGVHPVIGFLMGFFFYWMGVKMVPVFRRDRILNKPIAPPHPATMNAPNPMYAPMPQQQPQAVAPPPMPPPQVLVADASGYVNCPGCGSRTKAGRKTCMTCGGYLPAVYNPHIK